MAWDSDTLPAALKTFVLCILFAFVWIFGHHYYTLMPKNAISAGQVIQEGDFQRQGFYMSTDKLDLLTVQDAHAVIGHKALKDLLPNNYVHMADIQ